MTVKTFESAEDRLGLEGEKYVVGQTSLFAKRPPSCPLGVARKVRVHNPPTDGLETPLVPVLLTIYL